MPFNKSVYRESYIYFYLLLMVILKHPVLKRVQCKDKMWALGPIWVAPILKVLKKGFVG